MKNRELISIFLLTPLLFFSSLVKADEWDLSKVNNLPALHPTLLPVQRWCEINGSSVRFSNTEVPGYQPCGELKTQVVCDASGRKLISSGAPPKGYEECGLTPRIFIERKGADLAKQSAVNLDAQLDELPSSESNTNPNEQIASGLKTYQNYINGLDQLVDEKPKAKNKNKNSAQTAPDLKSLTGNISPEMLSQAMKMLSGLNGE